MVSLIRGIKKKANFTIETRNGMVIATDGAGDVYGDVGQRV